jgi:Uma2 family endonuclease
MVPTIPMAARMMAHARDRIIGRTQTMHMALSTHRWTRADLERLPDDGNRYEVIHGELLVSPAPRPTHAALVYAVRRLLEPYCEREALGMVSGDNQAFVEDDSEVIPDLVVRNFPVPPPEKWDDAPVPLLVVEVLSDSTRRNDLVKKRAFYMESGLPEYWIVDGDARSVIVVTPSGERTETGTLHWHPTGAARPLEADLVRLFSDVLGPRRSGP